MTTRLGVKLQRWRKRRKMTQVLLAKRARMSQSAIARLERGERRPLGATLKRLADALDVDMKELVE